MIGKTGEELQKEIHTFKTLSDDIQMELGFENCVKVVFAKGKLF
jgi:hypothetical protein